jgi:predicted outer membrane protein
LQHRAAKLAASRDTRPEVKSFAAEMAGWRETQLPHLRAFLAERGIHSPELTEDQRTVWEALVTLDFLALTRRYAEVQLQSLELEIAGYESATATGDPPLIALANETLPQLRQMLDGARRTHDAVKP